MLLLADVYEYILQMLQSAVIFRNISAAIFNNGSAALSNIGKHYWSNKEFLWFFSDQ